MLNTVSDKQRYLNNEAFMIAAANIMEAAKIVAPMQYEIALEIEKMGNLLLDQCDLKDPKMSDEEIDDVLTEILGL